MSEDKQLQTSRTINAAAEKIFTFLADPNRHTELDGAGMLRGVEGEIGTVSRVGDAFVMNMHQEALGDYQVRNEIVAFEPVRRIAWAPSIHPPGALAHLVGDIDLSGYYYAWDLAPDPEGGTKVTHTYDWSAVTDENAVAIFPIVSLEQMETTLEHLDAATRRS